jgi:hypothetical protein
LADLGRGVDLDALLASLAASYSPVWGLLRWVDDTPDEDGFVSIGGSFTFVKHTTMEKTNDNA